MYQARKRISAESLNDSYHTWRQLHQFNTIYSTTTLMCIVWFTKTAWQTAMFPLDIRRHAIKVSLQGIFSIPHPYALFAFPFIWECWSIWMEILNLIAKDSCRIPLYCCLLPKRIAKTPSIPIFFTNLLLMVVSQWNFNITVWHFFESFQVTWFQNGNIPPGCSWTFPADFEKTGDLWFLPDHAAFFKKPRYLSQSVWIADGRIRFTVRLRFGFEFTASIT